MGLIVQRIPYESRHSIKVFHLHLGVPFLIRQSTPLPVLCLFGGFFRQDEIAISHEFSVTLPRRSL